MSYTLNLKLADPQASTAFVHASTAPLDLTTAIDFTTWQHIADQNDRLVERAQETLLIGSWLLAALAVASVAGIVAGRIIGQRRRVGLLKAVGAGPAMVAAVHLAEYLVIGLAAGWLAAPPLTRPGAGLIGSVGAQPLALRAVVAATALALTIATAATLVPACAPPPAPSTR